MRWLTGSQSGLMWSYFLVRVTTRVAAFWTFCRRSIRNLGSPIVLCSWGRKISLLVMDRCKRSAFDFPCSDEFKRTLSQGTRSGAEFVSFIIEDQKAHTIISLHICFLIVSSFLLATLLQGFWLISYWK